MKLNQLSFLIVFFTMISVANARNWGHLLTGTTDTLKKDELTFGSLITGWGITDKLVVGTSPIVYFGYDFYTFIARYRYFESKFVNLGFDFFYFNSIDSKIKDSLFDQTSWFFKLNNDFRVSDNFSVSFSLGLQYFINDNSPYSLRPDPLGKYKTFAIKDDDPLIYQEKLEDFKNNPRDKTTHSVTVMPSYYLTKHFFINLEYGVLGTNYSSPLTHFGYSLNYTTLNWDLSFGTSISERYTELLGEESVSHSEIKIQYIF